MGIRSARLRACGQLRSSEGFSPQRSSSAEGLGSGGVPPLSREALGLSGSSCPSSPCPLGAGRSSVIRAGRTGGELGWV